MKIIIFGLALSMLTACAGPNPNPGERTTDIGWLSGKYESAIETAKYHAENGEPWAQLRMGIFYHNGFGVKKDYAEAIKWYSLASKQRSDDGWSEGTMVGAVGRPGHFNQNGDAMIAEFNIAKIQFYGSGSVRDLDKAYEHINNVIADSKGMDIFFCCEFSQSRYFKYNEMLSFKSDIEKEIILQKNIEPLKKSECYVHITNGVMGVDNTITLCVGVESANMEIYYLNPNDEPTICRRSGSLSKKSSIQYEIDLLSGRCENGRKVDVWPLSCKEINKTELICTDSKDNQITLKQQR